MNKMKSLAKSIRPFVFEAYPLAAVVLGVLAALPAPALDWSNAQIQSGTIIGGTETKTDGSKVTTIFQSSAKGIIDWGSAGNAADAGFKLAVNEALNLFNGAYGTTLMRDVTGQASKILGAINASGSIWVVNKAGVFIGSSAAIDVGKQFLAVAGDISDTDFLNGTYNFTDVSGEVWNVGSIKAGDDVILIGAKVINQGRIQAADQLAVGGFKTGEAGTLAMNVGGGKITFTVTSDASAGTVVNEGILENAAYAAQDMTPTADITGLTGKFNTTTDLTDGTYSVADGKVTYTQDGNLKTLIPATLGTADMSIGTYTAVRIQAQETIASLQGQGQVNASILAMETAAIKQSDTTESSPLDLGIGIGGDGSITASGNATIKATGGELAIGNANIAKTAVIEAAGEASVGNLQGSSVSLSGTKVTADSVTATTGAATITSAFNAATVNGSVSAATDVTIYGAAVATGAITAGQNVAIEAVNGITATGDITADAGNVTLRSTSGDIKTTGTLTGRDVTLNASGTGSDITVANIEATRIATIDAADTVTLDGSANARGVKVTSRGGDILAGATAGTVHIDAIESILIAAGKIGTAEKPLYVNVQGLAAAAGYSLNTSAPIPAPESGITLVQTGGDWAIMSLFDGGTGDILVNNWYGSTLVTGSIYNRQGGILLAGDGDMTLADGRRLTAEDGSVALLGTNPDSALILGAGATVAASGDVFLKGASLTMNATGAGSEIRSGGNAVITVGGDAALDRVVSGNGNIAVEAGGNVLDAQGDETTFDATGHATLAGGENLVAENGAISLAAGGIIGAATARDSSGRAVLPVDALEVKAQKISARAGGDLALQSSGDFTIGTVEAIAASGLPLIEGSEGTTHGAQSGIIAGGTANLAAAGEIRDDTGDETDVTAQKAVFTAGVGAGRDDALEIAVSGTGKNILWGNSVSGVSGGSVPMSVLLAGGNTSPDAGSLPDSNVRWQIDNGLNEGSESVDDRPDGVDDFAKRFDARVSGHIQCAAHSIFDDLPLTIQPHEVYMPFTFLSLDLGLMPSAGEGFIDYLLPVERRTEPEDLCQ